MVQKLEMNDKSFILPKESILLSHRHLYGEQRAAAVTCLNDAPYVQDPATGHFFCDCDQIASEDSFAGARCEFVATIYCEGPSVNDPDTSLFCTNQGNCTVIEDDKELEQCVCPEEWRGPHCEYPIIPDVPPEMESLHETGDALTELENEQPRNSIPSVSNVTEQERGGVVIGVFALLVSILACVGILARYYIKNKRTSHDRVAVWTQELQLDEEEDNISLAETREVT